MQTIACSSGISSVCTNSLLKAGCIASAIGGASTTSAKLVSSIVRRVRLRLVMRVRRSSMINTPPSDDLATKDAFGNFEFYCEYQIARHGRSGVLLRGLYRIPLLDDMGMAPSKTCSGSVSELLTPTKNTSKTADTWQALYVKFVGDIVTVILNGKKVIDARRLHESSGSVADEEVKAGPIVLLGTGGGVTFRNLRIKELPAE